MGLIIAIRMRGTVGVPKDMQETLKRLRLTKRFSLMMYPDTPSIRGMLEKVNPYISYGEATEEGIRIVIERMRVKGGDSISDEVLQKKFSITKDQLMSNILEGKILLNKESDFFELPVSLRSPKKGLKGRINSMYGNGGEVGYRGKEINKLIIQMS